MLKEQANTLHNLNITRNIYFLPRQRYSVAVHQCVQHFFVDIYFHRYLKLNKTEDGQPFVIASLENGTFWRGEKLAPLGRDFSSSRRHCLRTCICAWCLAVGCGEKNRRERASGREESKQQEFQVAI